MNKNWLLSIIVLSMILAVVLAAGLTIIWLANPLVNFERQPPSIITHRANSVVLGYTVTGIAYDLDATDPTIVDAITFSVSPTRGTAAAATVKLQTAAAGSWTNCTLAARDEPVMNVTCAYGALTLADVTAFNVVASSSIDP
jgi:hypothetical protein